MESFYSLAIIASILLAIFCIFSPLWERRQKKQRDAQTKAAKEAQRAKSLEMNGENIDTTVRQVDGNHIGTRGTHPITGAFLFFTGTLPPEHKQYTIGDSVKVFVDLTDPTNYKIHWEPDPWEIVRRLERERAEQIKRDELLFRKRPLKRAEDLPLPGNKRKKRQKCSSCHGKGTIETVCLRCNGKGHEEINRYKSGRKRVSREICSTCRGSRKIALRCRTCDGVGYIPRTNQRS